jgi:hypothetical protein
MSEDWAVECFDGAAPAHASFFAGGAVGAAFYSMARRKARR